MDQGDRRTMSEPTEADRQKATTLYESMRGHTKMANIESVCDAIAQARAEGRAAGRREMREEAARAVRNMRSCPFENAKCNIPPEVPCPVCGDRGDDLSAESHCQSPWAAITALPASAPGDAGETLPRCSTCGELHPIDIMCPPHEVRSRGKPFHIAPGGGDST